MSGTVYLDFREGPFDSIRIDGPADFAVAFTALLEASIRNRLTHDNAWRIAKDFFGVTNGAIGCRQITKTLYEAKEGSRVVRVFLRDGVIFCEPLNFNPAKAAALKKQPRREKPLQLSSPSAATIN